LRPRHVLSSAAAAFADCHIKPLYIGFDRA